MAKLKRGKWYREGYRNARDDGTAHDIVKEACDGKFPLRRLEHETTNTWWDPNLLGEELVSGGTKKQQRSAYQQMKAGYLAWMRDQIKRKCPRKR